MIREEFTSVSSSILELLASRLNELTKAGWETVVTKREDDRISVLLKREYDTDGAQEAKCS